jgi:hypothetical protein
MLDTKRQPSPAAAAADLFWTYAFTTARIADLFAARGAALWRRMLSPPRARRVPPMPPATSPRHESWPAANAEPSIQPTARAEPPAPPVFASYRSEGGHATAQVIVLPPRG